MSGEIVDFGKASGEAKSNGAVDIETRVLQCMKNEECECMYCNYRIVASEMVVDFLSRDVVNFENNTGGRMCTFDLKDILFKAIMNIKQMEKDGQQEESEDN